jgi:UDP-N-acetyl-2-amino-2-deoxyglucuronate dehydrogenase
MIMEPVKFAVIGCGHIGKRHAEMISRNKDSVLVALADISAPSQLHLEQWPHVPFFNSVDELLIQCPDVDVINIATPNGSHAAIALKVLQARKHVVIEKPMALTKADAEKIIYKALSVNKHVFSVMQNRYSPPSVWLKELIDSGILGDIYQVNINCLWNRDHRYYKKGNWHGSSELDGGTLFTQFSHFIDIMFWIFGDIENIHARMACHNHAHLTDFEDSGLVSFDFVNGGMGNLSFSTSVWDKNLESSITVIAENGSIKVGGQYMNEIEYCHINNYEMPVLAATNPANDYGSYKGSAANHHYVIENVVSVLKGNDTISTNALEGLKVVDIIERIYKSAGNISDKKSQSQIFSPYKKIVLNELQTA